MNQTAVKFLKDTPTGFVVGGYGVVWDGRDLSGEFFTKETDFWFDKITETPPVLYQHGMDAQMGKAVLGKVMTKRIDDVGLWIEAQIETHQQYADAIKPLVKRGVVGWSSGAPAHLVEKADDGQIKSWPVAEWSLTPTPCEPRTIGVLALRSFAEALPALKALLPETKAELDADARNALSDTDFAYIDAEGGRHLPIHDAAHVHAALSRFNQTGFIHDDDKKKAAKKIISKARALGVAVADDSAVAQAAKAIIENDTDTGLDADPLNPGLYFQSHPHPEDVSHPHIHADGTEHDHPHGHLDLSRTHDTDGHSHDILRVVTPTPDNTEERAETQAESFSEAMQAIAKMIGPVALEIDAIDQRLTAFVVSTRGLLDRRIKEGREFSTRNESALLAHADRLDGHAQDCVAMAGSIRGMVDASRTARESRTKAEHRIDPETLKAQLDILNMYRALIEPAVA